MGVGEAVGEAMGEWLLATRVVVAELECVAHAEGVRAGASVWKRALEAERGGRTHVVAAAAALAVRLKAML